MFMITDCLKTMTLKSNYNKLEILWLNQHLYTEQQFSFFHKPFGF